MSQERIQRFVFAERLAHWLYATFFLVAFIIGLLTWIPATRAWMGGARRTVETYHGVIGLLMFFLPVILLLILNRRKLAADLHEVDAWDLDDRRWFWAAVRGGTLRRREMPPQGRLNAGQKANSVLVAAMAFGFAVTGSLLLARAQVPAWLVTRALWLHSFLAVLGIALFVGHLAHVFVTQHGRKYLAAMTTGFLDGDVALERHPKWWAAAQEEEDPHSQ